MASPQPLLLPCMDTTHRAGSTTKAGASCDCKYVRHRPQPTILTFNLAETHPTPAYP